MNNWSICGHTSTFLEYMQRVTVLFELYFIVQIIHMTLGINVLVF
jgi:hypothetical protein